MMCNERLERAAADETVRANFWKKVLKSDGCWEWQGCTGPKGYGRITFEGLYILAHRFSYLIANGVAPGNLFVCHQCDNPNCVKPEHLWLGTAAQNGADKMAKGRYLNGNTFKTTCIRGHAFDEVNTKYRKDGKRYCYSCCKADVYARRAVKRAAKLTNMAILA